MMAKRQQGWIAMFAAIRNQLQVPRHINELAIEVRLRREIIEQARALFGERQLVELMGTIAGYNMVSRFLVVLGIDAAAE